MINKKVISEETLALEFKNDRHTFSIIPLSRSKDSNIVSAEMAEEALAELYSIITKSCELRVK